MISEDESLITKHETLDRDRLILLDVLRIIFALLVFARHAITMGWCIFGVVDDIILNYTNFAMTGFFIASGFSLYYVYSNCNLGNYKNIVKFYKKRAIAILPIYLLVVIVHALFLEENIVSGFKLAPIELTGIHAFFENTFLLQSNGTTWFVSCIIIAYFIYPYIQELVKNMTMKSKWIIFILISLLLLYLPYLFTSYDINAYSNPLLRGIEFVLGIVLCSIIDFSKIKKTKLMPLILFITVFMALTLAIYKQIYISTNLNHMLICLLIFITVFFRGFGKKTNAIIEWISSLTYPFYILQDFIWEKNKFVIECIRTIQNNYIRIMVCFIILTALTIIVKYLYQKPIKNFLNKYI